ncbi:hypothetical protein BRD18_07125 [Halobacteriales archaeon SW_7_71_33]|nr:MAG: hypothetical protein BRD18_07125 [Halobacteriales archaeon SW_7_71_33]
MTEFDPERFEDKYEHYFAELQTAYRGAFEAMNDRHDSELVHAIDQGVLAESEPFWEGDEFRVELPEDPVARVAATGVLVDEDHAREVVDEYVDRLEAELLAVFDLDG